MLYVTTRNKNDAHTSYRTLAQDRDTDGGLYVPFRLPKYSPEEIDALKEKSFGQCVAEMMRIMFGARLESWDVDFCIGRRPFRLIPLNHRIVVAETWRNPDWDFARLVRNLAGRVQNVKDQPLYVTSWAGIAVRICVTFGLFAELQRLGTVDSYRCMNVAVDASDLSGAVSMLYCKRMGLPIGEIVCSCTEEDVLWELFHSGELPSDQIRPCDNLERLIYEVLGFDETQRYVSCAESGKDYLLSEEDRLRLGKALHMMPVSVKRVSGIIPNIYATCTYVFSPQGSLAYGGLMDYRSVAVDRTPALLFTERSPLCQAEAVAEAMNMPVSELKARIH